jgi:hypothetical protein
VSLNGLRILCSQQLLDRQAGPDGCDADDGAVTIAAAHSQQPTAAALLGGEATFGELAWSWGQGRTARGDTWRRRLVYADGELIGWGWAYLPYRVELTDGSVRESKKSSLAYQYLPDHPEVFDEILAWFEYVTRTASTAGTDCGTNPLRKLGDVHRAVPSLDSTS